MPKRTFGPPPTLMSLRREQCWTWLVCQVCLHRVPVAIVPYMIRFGIHASSDVIRRTARCSRCGEKRVTLNHASWTGTGAGFETFSEALQAVADREQALAEHHDGTRPSGLVRVALGTKKPPALGSAEG